MDTVVIHVAIDVIESTFSIAIEKNMKHLLNEVNELKEELATSQ